MASPPYHHLSDDREPAIYFEVEGEEEGKKEKMSPRSVKN
jgi:hypothetical protein